jgi:formimidoylglutamate deiminase
MRYQRRRVLVGDELASPGSLLLEYGTRRGAVALDLETGIIAPGMLADFVAVDMHHPALAGWNADDFLDVLFFGASADAIVGVWVQGEKVCP